MLVPIFCPVMCPSLQKQRKNGGGGSDVHSDIIHNEPSLLRVCDSMHNTN